MVESRRRQAAMNSAVRGLAQISKANPDAIMIVPPGRGVNHDTVPTSSKMTAATERKVRNLFRPLFIS